MRYNRHIVVLQQTLVESMRLSKTTIITLIAIGFAACKPALPDGVISRSQIEAVLYDFHIAQSLAEYGDSADVRRYAYIQAVFKKHDITEAEFDSSMVWYCSHAGELRDIYSHLVTRYSTDAEALSAAEDISSITSSSDTTNIWQWNNMYYLHPTNADRIVETYLDADATFLCGDEILFRFDAFFIQKEGMRQAYAALVLRHDGDSIKSSMRTLHSDGRVELRLNVADTIPLKQISTYIYMPNSRDAKQPTQLVVTHPILVRITRKKP